MPILAYSPSRSWNASAKELVVYDAVKNKATGNSEAVLARFFKISYNQQEFNGSLISGQRVVIDLGKTGNLPK